MRQKIFLWLKIFPPLLRVLTRTDAYWFFELIRSLFWFLSFNYPWNLGRNCLRWINAVWTLYGYTVTVPTSVLRLFAIYLPGAGGHFHGASSCSNWHRRIIHSIHFDEITDGLLVYWAVRLLADELLWWTDGFQLDSLVMVGEDSVLCLDFGGRVCCADPPRFTLGHVLDCSK